jgi:hypothetical protein
MQLLGITNGDSFYFQSDVSPKADVVPEPGSLALLGIAAAGMVGYTWRRRRQAVVPTW